MLKIVIGVSAHTQRMTRDPNFSTKIAVLAVFLENGNRSLNVSRLASKVKEKSTYRFTKSGGSEADKVEPTIPTVNMACEELCKGGLLEASKSRPPRSSKTTLTKHYRLPVKRPEDTLKTTRFLLGHIKVQLINSTYGEECSSPIVMEHLKGVLEADGIKLSMDEGLRIRKIISESPEAMKRILTKNLMQSVERLVGSEGGKDAVVQGLIDYLSAVRTIDIADDNARIV